MASKLKYLFPSFFFVFLFVAQQVYSFVGDQFKLVSVYWLFIITLIVVTFFSLPKWTKKETLPIHFMAISMLGAFFSLVNGTGIGEVCQKIIYCFMGYVGLLYVKSYIIHPIAFDILIIILYVFFYQTFFSLDFATRLSLNDDLYNHSSSNTIAISLNMVLLLYFVLQYKHPNIRMLLYAITNLILIGIQGSRAGLLVAIILFSVISLKIIPRKYFYTGTVVLVTVVAMIIFKNLDIILEVVDFDNMQGVSSYEEDIRSRVQRGFFTKMSIDSFLFGYPPAYVFNEDITRTFNAFLDFWGRYGLFGFSMLMVCLYKRIIRRKQYDISLVAFLPLLAYSFFESLWGGTLWDLFIYIALFYTGNYADTKDYVLAQTPSKRVESVALS